MKLKPVFEAIAKDYPDIKFVKVNVEQYYPRFTDLKKKTLQSIIEQNGSIWI